MLELLEHFYNQFKMYKCSKGCMGKSQVVMQYLQLLKKLCILTKTLKKCTSRKTFPRAQKLSKTVQIKKYSHKNTILYVTKSFWEKV